ncbi:MAG TPA: hypothetical protein VHV58_02250 [Pseudolabrys sp.]|jgi:hypothetical protein|nr:hypothetical protein [Pseudolabrys sp.]
MQTTAEYLVQTADQCARLARLGREMADGLEAMSNDLMAKAVALDTVREKTEPGNVPQLGGKAKS